MLAADGVRLWAIHWGYGPDIAWAGFLGRGAGGGPVFFEVFLKNPFFEFFLIFFWHGFVEIKKNDKKTTRVEGGRVVCVFVCVRARARACVWCDFPFN